MQLLQILIVSLLMLHINIVCVVTFSDNSTRRLVTCIIGSFFNSFHTTLHSSIAATSTSQYKKKTNIKQNATNSCHVLQFHVLHFHVLHFHVLQFHALQF